MNTPLDDIALFAGSLVLTPEILGDSATLALSNGFNLNTAATLTNCSVPTPATDNLLIVQGSLSSFLGFGPAAVRLYLFELATVNGTTERHAILLLTDLAAAVTASALVAQFCPAAATGTLPVELGALGMLSLREQTLLFSTLDYRSPAYQAPPFPPMADPDAPQAFLRAVQPDVTAGYVFAASAQLQATLTFPSPPDAPQPADPEVLELAAILDALGMGALCSDGISANGQIALSPAGTMLNLFHVFSPLIAASSMPLNPSLTQVGIGLPLGSGALQIPAFELDGSLTLGSAPTSVRMRFEPWTAYLSVVFADLPDVADLETHFGSGVLSNALGSFLPPQVVSAVDSLVLLELSLTIDCASPSVAALGLSVTTEKPLSLFDGIEVQPALIANFASPFESYRSYEVQVAGKWLFKGAELDMMLEYDKGASPDADQTMFFAQLAIGSGIDLVDIAAQLFHAEVAGLPSLVLSGAEVSAQRSGSAESVSLVLDVDAGWSLHGIDIELDDLSLSITFAKASATVTWQVQEATAQGTLEIGPAFFALQAEYDADGKAWTFSGGSVPSDQVNLETFLTGLQTALGLDTPPSFLAPFDEVNLTGCYLQYQSSSSASPTWTITVSTDVQGTPFGSIALDQIVLSLSRNGGETSFSFDATAPAEAGQGVGAVTAYLASTLGVNLSLPSALTDKTILLQGLSASYNASTQSYSLVAYLNFGENALIHLGIDLVAQTVGKAGTNCYLGGTLIFNPGGTDEFEFKLELVESGGASDLVASFHAAAGASITLDKLVLAMSKSAPGLDEFEIDIQDALFAHSGGNSKSLFAVDMGAAVSLTKLQGLPLIGHELASFSSLDLAFQLVYSTGDYAESELQAINQMLGDPSFNFPAQALAANTPTVATSMRVSGQQLINMVVPVDADSQGNLSANGSGIGSSDPGATTTGGVQGITWYSLNKTLGPMHLSRVGLAFDASSTTITGYLDGGISVGPLTFDLQGLDVAVPLAGASKFIPSFGLQGLGLNYQSGPVEIGGALMKEQSSGTTSYNGFVTVSTDSLQIGAVASFAEMNDGENSLFVYAVLAEPLGGPAFFFVTGLAAGFGYNRKLLMPAISDVQNFPLVSEAMAPVAQPPAGNLDGMRDYVAQKLELMQQTIVPTAGEYFLAAGVKFTSFELIDGFLLAVVQFGADFRVDLLGLANATLPPDDVNNPVAEAQIAILAHYLPSEGAIWVQGQLTPNSYILSPACHLTGGFGLACWVTGAHAGQFVLSIGGYAPAYQVPVCYPNVPRVGYNWQVSDELTVKGDGYFALVPHALMAGGSWNAVWQSGPVSAWFLMGADFLIQWKPFHYSADIYVDLGAELTIHFFGTHHVSIDVSADLEVWGPEFGGHARISVSVIGIHFHFSIDFGAASAEPPPLVWEEFRDAFLPSDPGQWLGVNLQAGLIRTVTGTLDGSTAQVWIVNRDQLALVTSSALPITSAAFTLDGQAAYAPQIVPAPPGIAPMAVAAIATSLHTISITKMSSGPHSKTARARTDLPAEQLRLVPVGRKIPGGMWGHTRSLPLNPAAGEDVLDSVSGFSILPASQASEDPAAITVARSSLSYELTQQDGFAWAKDTGSFAGTPSTWEDIATLIDASTTTRAAALANMGFDSFRENYNQGLGRDAPIPAQVGSWAS